LSSLLNSADGPDQRRWRGGIIAAIAAVTALLLALFGFLVYVLLASSDAAYWSGEIVRFERGDISNPPGTGRIVFAGGGTIRKWPDLAQHMAPLPVINRGFGGAHVAHVTHYAPRIIAPYAPKAVVIAAGGDDLADVGGKPPDQVASDMAALVAVLRPAGLEAGEAPQVYILSIPPTPARAARWPAVQEVNTRIASLAAAAPGVQFIDLTDLILDDAGNITDDLFRWDGLTLNAHGYAAVSTRVRTRLLADLGDAFPAEPAPVLAPVPAPVSQPPPAP